MKGKIKKIITSIAVLLLVFSAGTAVYADTASNAEIAVFSLPGTDIVGGGTKPAEDPEAGTPETGTPETAPEEETEQQPAQETAPEADADAPAQTTSSQSGALVLAEVPDTADTADIEEIALLAAILGASGLVAIVMMVMVRIEKRRLLQSEEHERIMDEFRRSCSDARKNSSN